MKRAKQLDKEQAVMLRFCPRQGQSKLQPTNASLQPGHWRILFLDNVMTGQLKVRYAVNSADLVHVVGQWHDLLVVRDKRQIVHKTKWQP